MSVALAGSGLPERIGPYGIRQELGRGGMGIVYLGRDSKLDRSVAIKVLSDSMAHDPDRLARFEREARLLASLSHPNIAMIHGLEDDGGRRFLTLEYVEGETLAEHIDRGPMQLGDVIDVCVQIAHALEAAHESGVIHRDLKPSNVKVKPSGEVKVLDFGLAKGMVTSSSDNLDVSPTITYAPTAIGVILGTAAYMSPEQARGRPVDRRTDIWSFGCVLFECLTGRQAFAGETTSDTIARILVQEPDWKALPDGTPGSVRHLVQRCLEKDPKRRLRDIGEARLALEDARAGRTAPSGTTAVTTMPARRRGGFLLSLVAASLIGVGLGFGIWKMTSPTVPAGGRYIARYSIALPPDLKVRGGVATPDGSTFLFTAKPRKETGGSESLARVYKRRADSYDLTAIPGTEGVHSLPIPTQDGRSIIYVAPASVQSMKKKIFKAPLDGSSPPVVLGDWQDAWRNMAELANGDLLIFTDLGKSFVRVPARGGPPGPVVKIDFGTYGGCFEALPQGATLGSHALLTNAISYGPRGWMISVGVLDPETGKGRILVENGGSACFAPSGHLLFTRGDIVHAVRFDRDRLEVRGEPAAILSGVRTMGGYWPGAFQLFDNGTLFHAPGGRVGEQRQIMSLDPQGSMKPLTEDRKAYYGLIALSATGNRIAIPATNESGLDEIWVLDPGRSVMRRLVADNADCNWPVWSPDGKSLAFWRRAHDDKDGIYVQSLEGGTPRRIFKSEGTLVDYAPRSWSPDGRSLLLTRTKDGNADVWVLPLDAESRPAGEPRALLATRAQEYDPAWSPDGRSIAFCSDESGKYQVYVAEYRANGTLGVPADITRGSGMYPRWTSPSRIVYFDDMIEKGVAVNLTTSPEVTASDPVPVLDHRELRVNGFNARGDGSLVVVRRSADEDDMSRYSVTLNWLEELRAKAPR